MTGEGFLLALIVLMLAGLLKRLHDAEKLRLAEAQRDYFVVWLMHGDDRTLTEVFDALSTAEKFATNYSEKSAISVIRANSANEAEKLADQGKGVWLRMLEGGK